MRLFECAMVEVLPLSSSLDILSVSFSIYTNTLWNKPPHVTSSWPRPLPRLATPPPRPPPPPPIHSSTGHCDRSSFSSVAFFYRQTITSEYKPSSYCDRQHHSLYCGLFFIFLRLTLRSETLSLSIPHLASASRLVSCLSSLEAVIPSPNSMYVHTASYNYIRTWAMWLINELRLTVYNNNNGKWLETRRNRIKQKLQKYKATSNDQ